MSDTNLRLQVILNAVDKLTRPFRTAQASSKELATAIQQSRARLKELDAQAGRIDGFRKASAQLAVTGNSLKAAREEAAKLATQFSATNRPTAAQARLLEQAKNRVNELQSKYNGLRQSVQCQRLALNEAGLDTKKLSSAQRELRQNADETRQALDRQQKSLKRLGEQQARMDAVRDQYSRRLQVRDRIAGAGATTTAAGLAMGAPVMAAVKSYASMEDAMKGVAKQVNGLRDDNGKVNKLPQDKRLSAMTMIFGKEFGDDAAKLANNLPELQRQLKLTSGTEANGSMQKESDINKDSLSAQWLLVKTGAQNAFSSLGETLRQPLMDIMGYVKNVTGALRRWVEANPQLAGTLMKVAAATAAITVVLGTLAVAVAAVLGPLAVIRFGLSVLGVKTLPSVMSAVTRTGGALSWLANAPLSLLRRGLAASGSSAGLLASPLNSLRRSAGLAGNALKALAGAPLAVLRGGMSGIRNIIGMVMNPLAALRGGLSAAGGMLRFLASGPLALLRVALYGISGLLGAMLSPIGLVVAALAGVALVVWKYWQPISAFLGGVVEGFKAAAAPISAAFEPLQPVFQWIGNKVQALWGWFTDLLTPVKSISAELQSAASMGRQFGEALAEGLNMVMHPLDSLKSGVAWLLEKLGIVSREAAKAKLPEKVTRQQPATVNTDGKVVLPPGGFPTMGFAGMYDSGGTIPRGQFGIVGENGPEIVNGPANVTGRKRTADLARVAATLNPSRTEPASAKQRPERAIVLPPDSVNGPANLPVINRTTELVKLAATVSPVRDVTASPEQRPESRLILPPEIFKAPVNRPGRDRAAELADIAAAVMPAPAITEITDNRVDQMVMRQKVFASVVAGVMGLAATPAEAAPLHPYSVPVRTQQAPSAKTERQPQVLKYEISAPIHIVAQPGQSAQDIAREVARQLDERERRARAKTRSNFSDRGGYE